MKSSKTPSAVKHIVATLTIVKKIIFGDHSQVVIAASGNMNSELQAKRGPISCLGGNFKTKCLVRADPTLIAMAARRARIVGSIWKRYRKIVIKGDGHVRSHLVGRFKQESSSWRLARTVNFNS